MGVRSGSLRTWRSALGSPIAGYARSHFGTSRHFAATQQLGRFRSEVDIGPEFMSTLPLSKVVRTKELRQTGRLMAMLQAAIDA
jgi:hypothetical protein